MYVGKKKLSLCHWDPLPAIVDSACFSGGQLEKLQLQCVAVVQQMRTTAMVAREDFMRSLQHLATRVDSSQNR